MIPIKFNSVIEAVSPGPRRVAMAKISLWWHEILNARGFPGGIEISDTVRDTHLIMKPHSLRWASVHAMHIHTYVHIQYLLCQEIK